MREFYRQQEPQSILAPVDLSLLAKTGVGFDAGALERHAAGAWHGDSRLDTELPDGLAPVAGVESEIREALTNLVFNAVDAMPDGRHPDPPQQEP